MSQDFKCAIGLHKYEVIEKKDVKNPYSAIIGTIIISRCTKFSDRAYTNAIACLQDLCDILNDKFPGSNLTIISSKGEVKVKGELKYLIKHDN